MRRKLLSLALALVMCLGLAVPAMAAETVTETYDAITITANPNGTLSFTGDGEFWMDHMYMGLDMLLYATDYLEGVSAVSISVGSGAVNKEDMTFAEMARMMFIDLGLEGIPLYVNGSPVDTAVQQPVKEEPKPAPAPEKKEAITEDLGDGIQITADPNGTLSYTGAGALTPDHVYIGLDMLYGATDSSEFSSVSVSIAPGITYDVLKEMGCDSIEEAFETARDEMGFVIEAFYINQSPAQQPAAPAGVTAAPTSAKVLVNGRETAFDAYSIEGNNYFKLRDLAYVLNGTEKQFEVGWDNASKTITLTSGSAYTAVGGEMSTKGSGAQSASASASKLLIDGQEVSLTAYTIGGNNYFKLRDIGQAFDFGIGWDNASKTITIDTSTGYTA